jgi:hypothetical protein
VVVSAVYDISAINVGNLRQSVRAKTKQNGS